MAANPFLFTEDEYISPHSTASNPFLVDEPTFHQDCTDNPFLCESASDIAQNSTNPFAFDPTELETSDSQSQFVHYSFDPVATTQSLAAVNNSDHNFFSVTPEDAFADVSSTNIPQKPTELDLKYTNTIADPNDQFTNEANVTGSSRGIPPPRPPPSKETQDLLMSVMGAMDATSSHLLDRIPPTRTPSPVSVRDAQSPSPTPEPAFGDLLDVSDANKPLHQKNNSSEDLLMMSLAQDDNSCDINQNVESVIKPQSEQVKPARPAPPARPPRPLPPQKPPPPTNVAAPQPPPKPAPPAVVQSQKVDDTMLDFLGSEGTVPPKPKASTADILNLYQAQKQETQIADLLFDTVETAVEKPLETVSVEEVNDVPVKTPTPTKEISIPEVAQETNVNVAFESTPAVQDNFLSPEPVSDLHMDTSDTQSKDSVSSVTFNPFSANEEMQQQVQQTDVFQNNKNIALDEHTFNDDRILDNNVFSPSPAKEIPMESKTGDAFDAFAQKFESAAKDEVKNGAFDAFCNGNDAWGNDAVGVNDSSGFDEAEGSFDAFLAMQEPPAVPQSTPSRLNKAGSEDSDEDKDFSVFIK